MQLQTSRNNAETGTVIQSGNFGISESGKMFRILSDGMYKDKIGSMVRELSSNARDAHVDTNQADKPFVIHLPNAFEPWFSVTDFGSGISAEDIFKVLCVYGESTKDQTNDAIGAFGLGAKTPYAYTDNFTVRSRFEGMERLYTASIDSSDMPVMNLQMEQETTESNGFQITVSVSDSDFNRFKDKTIEQLKFFPVKPTVENCSNFEWEDTTVDIAYESDLVTMYNGGWGGAVNGLMVIQGGVGYPVDIDLLDGIDKTTQQFAEALKEKSAVMEFAIGDIDVTAPRENISYVKRTIDNIIARIAEVAKSMSREVFVEVSKEPSIWNRAVIYNKQLTVIQKAIRQSPLFDKLFSGMDKDRHGNLAVNMDDLVALKCNAVNMVKFNSYRSNAAATTVMRKVLGNSSRHSDEYLTAAQQINVYLRDTNSKPMARVKHFVFENDFPLTIVIESYTDELLTASDKVAVAKALRMPVGHINLLSELEAPKNTAQSGERDYTAPKAYQWSSREDNSCSRKWDRLYDDINDIGAAVWVEMDRHDVKWCEDSSMMFSAAGAGQLGYDVIAVNGRTARRIEAGKIGADLVSVKDAADEVRAEIKDKTSLFIKYARDRAFVSEMNNSSVIMTLAQKGMLPKLEKQLVNMHSKNQTMAITLEDHTWIRRHLDGISGASEKGVKRAKHVREGIMLEFPMLKYIAGRHGALLEDDVLADVMIYIEDKKNKVGLDSPA